MRRAAPPPTGLGGGRGSTNPGLPAGRALAVSAGSRKALIPLWTLASIGRRHNGIGKITHWIGKATFSALEDRGRYDTRIGALCSVRRVARDGEVPPTGREVVHDVARQTRVRKLDDLRQLVRARAVVHVVTGQVGQHRAV